MKLNEINIRDPFILTYNNKYYLYGSRAKNQIAFDVYEGDDLENWSEPKCIFEKYDGFWGTVDFWAPEVHIYKDKFYMLASFRREGMHRGTAILVSDTPNGTFKEYSKGAITPPEWDCLDGTLYIENDIPYMVFCHEWIQIKDGEVCAIKLSDDLKKSVGNPFTLWKASDAHWVRSIKGEGNFVTDGPYMYKRNNNLICIWSSFSETGYVEAMCKSENGSVTGKWSLCDKLVFDKDGGHGMIFKTFDGINKFIFHSPNKSGLERPVIRDIDI